MVRKSKQQTVFSHVTITKSCSKPSANPRSYLVMFGSWVLFNSTFCWQTSWHSLTFDDWNTALDDHINVYFSLSAKSLTWYILPRDYIRHQTYLIFPKAPQYHHHHIIVTVPSLQETYALKVIIFNLIFETIGRKQVIILTKSNPSNGTTVG